jgi:nucleoside-diphosphate-sugar epimerase
LYSRIRLDLVLNVLTVRAATTGKIQVFGGEQYRPLLHVKDVASAVRLGLDSEATGVFNLHYKNVRISELGQQVVSHFPGSTLEVTDMPFQDTRNYRVNSSKAQKFLGFHPTASIDQGIEEVKSLVLQHRIKDLDHDRYSNQRYIQRLLKT